MQPRSPMTLFNRGVPRCEGPPPLCTSTRMTNAAQEPVLGKRSQLLSWDSFQPDLFLDLLHHKAMPAQVTGEGERE